jgi:alpha-tubulin suppressor-like RCC1 family protein
MSFTCGLHADGTIVCWGCDDDCVAGFLTPPSGTFVQVTAGGGHACALKTDGTVTCWGSTFYGESTPPASD